MNGTAIVTGASGGLGAALTAKLLNDGWTVIAGVRDPEKAANLAGLPHARGSLHIVKANVAHDADRKRLVEAAQQRGNLTLLINNAGTAMGNALEYQSMEDIRTVFSVNFFSAIELTKLCLPLLRKSGGHVVNISSVVGTVPLPYLGAYSASKHALNASTIALSLEMQDSQVRFILAECGPLSSKLCSSAIVDASDPDYAETQSSMKEGVARIGDRYAVPVEQAADSILRALRSTKTLQRIIIGKWARMILILSKLVPSGLFQMLLARHYRVQLRRKHH